MTMKIDEEIIRKVIYNIDDSGEAKKDEEFVRNIEYIIFEMIRLQKNKNADKKRNN